MNEQHSAGSTETHKHTPGPWKSSGLTVESVTDGNICLVNLARPAGPTEANLRLIAAAPELLAKLHDVAAECSECAGTGKSFRYKNGERYEISCRDCDDIRKVIAKAEGRS